MTQSAELVRQQLLEVLRDEDIATLMALLKRVRIDPVNGDVTICNTAGNASVVLSESGKVRLHGVEIVQVAERTITLDAAVVDLN